MEIEEVVALVKRLGELNQATNDALVIICTQLHQGQSEPATKLHQMFQELSEAPEPQATPALKELSRRLAASLSGDVADLKLDSLTLPGPEEFRATFRLIQGTQGYAEPRPEAPEA